MSGVNEEVEGRFLACLLALGPEATLVEVQKFMELYIPSGWDAAWYAAWYINRLEKVRHEQRAVNSKLPQPVEVIAGELE